MCAPGVRDLVAFLAFCIIQGKTVMKNHTLYNGVYAAFEIQDDFYIIIYIGGRGWLATLYNHVQNKLCIFFHLQGQNSSNGEW